MTQTLQNALEIANAGGAIAASDWTLGTGNFISKRPIPLHCREIDASEADTLRGRSGQAARRLLRARPRVRKLIIVADWRKLNRATRQPGAPAAG